MGSRIKLGKWHFGNAGRPESAGINRHRVGDERALHKRSSCSIVAPGKTKGRLNLGVSSFICLEGK